jgi:DNA-directed RNA polymerase specialized sigma24 family protein
MRRDRVPVAVFSEGRGNPHDIGVISWPGSKRLSLQKLYLAPFTDEQVDNYLRRTYRRGRRREEARKVVSQIPDLVARPLLLTYVEDLTAAKGIKFTF